MVGSVRTLAPRANEKAPGSLPGARTAKARGVASLSSPLSPHAAIAWPASDAGEPVLTIS